MAKAQLMKGIPTSDKSDLADQGQELTFYSKYKEKPFRGDREVARSVKRAVCYVAVGKGQKWR